MFRSIVVAAIVAASVDALNVGPKSFVPSPRVVGKTSPRAVAVPLDIPLAEPVVEEETSKSSLAPEDQWIANLDYDAFAKDVTALGKELLKETGNDDVEHLQKIVGWRNIAALVGLATVWATPNPITIAALSTWTYASWTMIAHHSK